MWTTAFKLITMLFFCCWEAALAQTPTHELVRGAAMRALETLPGNSGVEIITQGSWNSLDKYTDPLSSVSGMGSVSDHDMRVFLKRSGVSADEAASIWKQYRLRLDAELRDLVSFGKLDAKDLDRLRRSINVYPPEQMLENVADFGDALKEFRSRGTFPNLIDTTEESAQGAYGKLLQYERQEFETGARVKVLFVDKGVAKSSAWSDLNHLFEGNGLRKPLNLATAAEAHLDSALHAVQQNARNLKDVSKYMKRGAMRLTQAKIRLGLPASASDTELVQLQESLEALWKEYESLQPKSLLGATLQQSSSDAARQTKILQETAAQAKRIEAAMKVAGHEALILQNLAALTDRGSFVRARFYRLILAANGKWQSVRALASTYMGSLPNRMQQVGYLNVLAGLYEFYSIPANLAEEGPAMAGARLAKGLLAIAVPEIGLADLIVQVGHMVAELSVDYVKSFGYSVVGQQQSCVDMMAGFYSVGGRETQLEAGDIKTCHKSDSVRTMACEIYDEAGLRVDVARGGKLDPRGIPSKLRSMIACHAENASFSYSADPAKPGERRNADKGVEQYLVNRCSAELVPAWLAEREAVIGELVQLGQAIDGSSLAVSYDPRQSAIADPAKGTRLQVHASLSPGYRELFDDLKARIKCAGGPQTDAYVREQVRWKQDGVTLERGSLGTQEFSFAKPQVSTVCVAWELEYGPLHAPLLGTPSELRGKLQKEACTDIQTYVDVGQEKLALKMTNGAKAAAPARVETGQSVRLTAELTTKRDPKSFFYEWRFGDGVSIGKPAGFDERHTWMRADSYDIQLDVYEVDELGVGKKGKVLASTKHKITVEPTLEDLKSDVKVVVEGPKTVKLGETIRLRATVQAPPSVQSKLGDIFWSFDWTDVVRVGAVNEDPDGDAALQNAAIAAKGTEFSHQPVRAGTIRFDASVFGQGVRRSVASGGLEVLIECRQVGKEQDCGDRQSRPQPSKLEVFVMPARRNVATGDAVLVNAVAQGGKPPFRFAWTPTVDGQGPDVVFRPIHQAATLSVMVTDATGAQASQAVNFSVDSALPAIEGIQRQEVFGTRKRALLPIDTDRVVVWQASPPTELDPDTGWVTFDRMGHVKLWAEVRVRNEGSTQPLGSTEQVDVEVVAPSARLAFDPPAAAVGQPVTARVELSPALDGRLVYYVWTDPPTANREELAPNSVRFKSGATPVRLAVEVRAKRTNDSVARLEASFDAGAGATATSITAVPGNTSPDATATKARQAGERLAQAQQAASGGDLDAAIRLAGEASGLDPQLTQANTLANQWQTERRNAGQRVSAMDAALKANRMADARRELTAAQSIAPKYPLVVEAAKRLQTLLTAWQQQVQRLLTMAKTAHSRGELDQAASSFDEAAQLDPEQLEARRSAQQIRQDKQTIDRLLQGAQPLLEANRFDDAQQTYTQAFNLSNNYPPVRAFEQQLSQRRSRYAAEVRDKLYEVRSTAERKEFKHALDIAAAWRASTRLDAGAERDLKQQEDWVRQLKGQQDQRIKELAGANTLSQQGEYEAALKAYETGFSGSQNLFNGKEPEFIEAGRLRELAFKSARRLAELAPHIQKAAENPDPYFAQLHVLDAALKAVNEAMALQPGNPQWGKFREAIIARAQRTRDESQRLAQGRKYLESARSDQARVDMNDAAVRSRQQQWSEPLEAAQQQLLASAIANYQESLKFIPDPAVTKHIGELQTALQARRKSLDNYHASTLLRKQADAANAEFAQEPAMERALSLADQAIDLYRRSLALHRPPDAEILDRHISNLDYGKHDRLVRKYSADGYSLEQAGRLGEAIAAFDQAVASYHPTVPQSDRMGLIAHTQELRNRINSARAWRVDGETKQAANQISQAITSFRNSLKLLPDAALEQHTRQLEAALEANRVRAAQLRSEGQALQQQNRLPEAIARYRQSLALVPDPALEQHIRTLEQQQQANAQQAAQAQQAAAQALRLRTEGEALQRQNRIPEAIAKYRQSLSLVPDRALEQHIQTLERALQTPAPLPPTPVDPGGRSYTAIEPAQPPTPAAKPGTLLDSGNVSSVYNLPTRPTVIRLAQEIVLTSITNYHWNDGRGTPRTGSITLRDAAGRSFGPWPTSGRPGQGGVPNAYWSATPNVRLPAGDYTVIDSDPASWSQNSGSGGAGHTRFEGYPTAPVAGGRVASVLPSATTPHQPTPTAPQLAPQSLQPGHFDGSYVGQFGGDGGGPIRFTIRGQHVQGLVNGNIDGDKVSATLSGSVNAAGQITLQVKGVVQWRLSSQSQYSETPFNGQLTGTFQGSRVTGHWVAVSVDQDDKRSGTWTANR